MVSIRAFTEGRLQRDDGSAFNGRPFDRPHDSHGPSRPAGPLQCVFIARRLPSRSVSAHTALPPPPSRTPAGSSTSGRGALPAPLTTSAHGLLLWDARQTRI